MQIARDTSHSGEEYARGLLTPWARALCHVAFAGAVTAANETLTNQLCTEIEEDLNEALKHLDSLHGEPSAFLSADVINSGSNLREQLREFVALELSNEAEELDRLQILDNLQNIMHNAVGMMAKAESELWGTDADAGRLL